MGAIVRSILTRRSAVFWAAAAALAIARTVTGGQLPDLGEIFLFGLLGASRDITAAINGRDHREKEMLIRELAEVSRPRSPSPEPRLALVRRAR